jgi:hypothetical protein
MPPQLVPGLALLNAVIWTGRNTVRVPVHDINLHLVVSKA